jgi:hypothetical protein
VLGEFAYNNKIHSVIQVSPFYANYGFNPRMGFEPQRQTNMEAVNDFTGQMKHIHEEAQVVLMKVCDEMKHYVDQHWGETPEYRVGQKVWIEAEDLDLKHPSKKLTER